MTRPRVTALVAAGFLTAAALLAAAGQAEASIVWGPVDTVASQSFDHLSTVTDDNGLVVAAWAGHTDHDVYIAVRKGAAAWSTPTRIVTETPLVQIATGGKGAWVLWVDPPWVTVAHVAANGAVGTPTQVGAASEDMAQDAKIAVGANGAVAVAWHYFGEDDSGLLAWKPHHGGGWQDAESLDWGTIAGLNVDAEGYIDVIAAKDNPDLWHQKVTYHRGDPSGGFYGGVVVTDSAYLTTAAGNPHGGFVVGWEQDNGDGTYSAVARYKPEGAAFGSARQLYDNVPFGTHVAMAVAESGYGVAVYHVSAVGTQQVRLSPVTSSGQWLTAQTLPLTGFSYGVAIAPAGDALVTSRLSSGVQLVSCPEQEACGAAETNPAPDRFPLTSFQDDGVINLLWGRGCLTRACYPTSLVAQRGS
jgi:hypothetical protein